ncbi:MAG: thioredoxin family protein [Euryarchaeota archaeon]|nr:thioredoxin family protein [Euryarchaeota archaeon]
MKIELYVEGTETIRTSYPSPGSGVSLMGKSSFDTRGRGIKRAIIDTISYTQDCEEAIKIVEEFTLTHGLKMKVYDISGLLTKRRARAKGIKSVPAVVIGEYKIEGVPTLEELEDILAKA